VLWFLEPSVAQVKSQTVIWTLFHQYCLRTASPVCSGLKKHFATILSLNTAFLHVLWFLEPSMAQVKSQTVIWTLFHQYWLRTAPPVCSGLEKTLCHHSLTCTAFLHVLWFLEPSMAQLKNQTVIWTLFYQYCLRTAPPVCSGPEKHFATILSIIQPSCICCGF